MCPIWKSSFQGLAFLIPRNSSIREIPKTMIFVDKIEDIIELEKYLQSKLSNCIYNRTQSFMVIRTITSNLNATIKTKIMENL